MSDLLTGSSAAYSTALGPTSSSLVSSLGSRSGSVTASSSASAPDKRIASTADEFESILLGQWLQNAESSFGTVPGAEDDKDAGGEQMQSFAMQQLARGLTHSGGIGIAKLISGALEQRAAAEPPKTVTQVTNDR